VTDNLSLLRITDSLECANFDIKVTISIRYHLYHIIYRILNLYEMKHIDILIHHYTWLFPHL